MHPNALLVGCQVFSPAKWSRRLWPRIGVQPGRQLASISNNGCVAKSQMERTWEAPIPWDHRNHESEMMYFFWYFKVVAHSWHNEYPEECLGQGWTWHSFFMSSWTKKHWWNVTLLRQVHPISFQSNQHIRSTSDTSKIAGLPGELESQGQGVQITWPTQSTDILPKSYRKFKNCKTPATAQRIHYKTNIISVFVVWLWLIFAIDDLYAEPPTIYINSWAADRRGPSTSRWVPMDFA